MSEKNPVNRPKKWKMAVIVWLSIYPLITLVLALFGNQILQINPLPLRTFVLTLVIIPLMVYVMMPLMQKVFAGWLKK